jgi:hypothetical protein
MFLSYCQGPLLLSSYYYYYYYIFNYNFDDYYYIIIINHMSLIALFCIVTNFVAGLWAAKFARKCT